MTCIIFIIAVCVLYMIGNALDALDALSRKPFTGKGKTTTQTRQQASKNLNPQPPPAPEWKSFSCPGCSQKYEKNTTTQSFTTFSGDSRQGKTTTHTSETRTESGIEGQPDGFFEDFEAFFQKSFKGFPFAKPPKADKEP